MPVVQPRGLVLAVPVFGEECSIRTSLSLLAVLLLVLANGFSVATEFALVSVRRTRMQQLAADGNRRAQQVLGELKDLDTYIAATQLGITIASLALGWIGEPAVASLIEPLIRSLQFIPDASREAVTHTISFIVAFAFITTLHIVIGELAPKSIALQRAEQTALRVAGPIHLFYLALRPAIVMLNTIGNAVVRLIGIEPASGHQLVQSAEELRLAVDASREAGLVEDSAHDLVDRALLFPDLEAQHAMVPRTEIAAVSASASVDEVIETAVRSGHSRLPVYEGDLDHIIGVVSVKRLWPRLLAERASGTRVSDRSFQLQDLMTEVLAIPETSPASALLPRLRDSHTPMAIVIDEYGGTAGLITLVDLVESLVGDITDELDPVRLNGLRTADGSFSLDGLTTLMEAKEYYNLHFADDTDVETVGGYVFSQLGRPANVGDEIVTPDGQILRTEELDGLRVARVRVVPANGSATAAEALSGSAA